MRRPLWLLAAIVLLGLWLWAQHGNDGALPVPASDGVGVGVDTPRTADALPAFLPPEARPVLVRIAKGGPHPHRQDGGVFQNRERRLPQQPRGWYREYTVATPGARDRGARRIVTGGDPPSEYWYTRDHYRSFRRFDWAPAAGTEAAR
ncbi:ribonuclease domain-containing protein [Marilutibacter alkalisoli]|uniref:Ribonuclease n=1 Tax=Marilutibacter alkalisoli TaxID=2591633 RepID=A0A514BN29_9GAMM|nr:ribonuclease domain-containing protein [Lysobacter alkalisoli]QDH68781.1 ribonuclease [Lysobacter alkalisoli]